MCRMELDKEYSLMRSKSGQQHSGDLSLRENRRRKSEKDFYLLDSGIELRCKGPGNPL